MFGKKEKRIQELENRVAALELGFTTYAQALERLNTLVTVQMFDVLNKLSYAQECLLQRIEQLYDELDIKEESEDKILN